MENPVRIEFASNGLIAVVANLYTMLEIKKKTNRSIKFFETIDVLVLLYNCTTWL